MATKSKKLSYRCTECGWMTAKWAGRCGECQAWGTVEEVGVGSGPKTTAARISVNQRATPISTVDASFATHHPTDVPELDRVLGGGLIPGGVILMAGEPGIGKSTLVLDVAAKVAKQEKESQASASPNSAHNHPTKKVLYVTGEESMEQVRMRADRINAIADTLYIIAENDLAQVLGHIEDLKPDLFIVDSVQTIQSEAIDGTAGGVNQIREVTNALIAAAKSHNITAILVGHVTKDGNIAGPRMLEHLVDVVCQFEGDRHSRLRMVRAVKNRYGATDDVGCFDLADNGIHSVEDPSGLFLTSRSTVVPGTAITVTLEGRRPLLAEVQTLMDVSQGGAPRRTVSGLDNSRVAMLLAVMQQHMKLHVSKDDVYVSTVGGIKISEPAADLAVAVAIASSKTRVPTPGGLVIFGEVGLAGELRPVPGIQKRIIEAARLGFRRAIIPLQASQGLEVPEGFRVHKVRTVEEGVRAVFDNQVTQKRREQEARKPQPPASEQVTYLNRSEDPAGSQGSEGFEASSGIPLDEQYQA